MTPEDIAYLEFIHLPTYRRSAEALLDDEGQREIEAALCADPSLGAVIAGTGGVRKLRVALPGTGKSGGVRPIYFYRQSRGRIYNFALPKVSERQSHERRAQ